MEEFMFKDKFKNVTIHQQQQEQQQQEQYS